MSVYVSTVDVERKRERESRHPTRYEDSTNIQNREALITQLLLGSGFTARLSLLRDTQRENSPMLMSGPYT